LDQHVHVGWNVPLELLIQYPASGLNAFRLIAVEPG
jgi:hypothetical protein